MKHVKGSVSSTPPVECLEVIQLYIIAQPIDYLSVPWRGEIFL